MKRIYILLFCILALRGFAWPPHTGPRYGFSYGAGTVISIFKTDTRESGKAVPRPGFEGMLRMHFYPAPNVHIQLGLEVMTQSCAFNTYYFAPAYSMLYDSSYGYTHTLRTLELYVPLIGRVGLNPAEGNSQHIFYLMAGYAPKIFVGARSYVVRNSDNKGIWYGATNLVFENYFMSEQLGNVIIAGFGYDKRFHFDERFLSFETFFKYNLSRFIYSGNIDTNKLLIKNMCISLQVSYRFSAGGVGRGG